MNHIEGFRANSSGLFQSVNQGHNHNHQIADKVQPLTSWHIDACARALWSRLVSLNIGHENITRPVDRLDDFGVFRRVLELGA